MSNPEYCTNCGTVDYPKSKYTGSFIAELLLWIIFAIIAAKTTWILLLAPFTFSIVRAVSKSKVCSACGQPTTIPTDSPRAKEMKNNSHKEEK